MLNRTPRIPCFLILPVRDGRGHIPEDHEDGNSGEDGEEEGGPETTADLPCEVYRDAAQQEEHKAVVKAFGAGGVGRERGILDGEILRVFC